MSFSLLIYNAESSAYREKGIKSFTQLTQLPHLALSTSYLQHRILYYNDISNVLYPQMREQHKLDLIYAQ